MRLSRTLLASVFAALLAAASLATSAGTARRRPVVGACRHGRRSTPAR